MEVGAYNDGFCYCTAEKFERPQYYLGDSGQANQERSFYILHGRKIHKGPSRALHARDSKTAWGTCEHHVRSRYEIPILLLEKPARKSKKQAEVQYCLLSSDRCPVIKDYTDPGRHVVGLRHEFQGILGRPLHLVESHTITTTMLVYRWHHTRLVGPRVHSPILF